MKHYLITGGAGFIGTNLSIYLLNLGHKVTIWDNLSSGFKKNLPTNARFILVDITNCWETLFSLDSELYQYDAIFNLACPASPPKYQINPIETLLTCVLGTKNMLDIATRYNIPILHASTSEIYGDPQVSPQSENYLGYVNCNGVRSCYDEGKRASETLCFDYNRKYGTKVKVVRIFNTYGPYMDVNDGRVVSNFINQSLNNKPLSIYGDGLQTRSLCYIDDMIDGLYKMINTTDDVTGPINLGNDNETTITYISEIISMLTSNNNILEFYELPKDDPKRRKPDISKAKTILDWEPKIKLEDGLNKTILYFRSIIDKSIK